MDYIKEFNKYVKNFDLNIKEIMKKYHHSFRVMEYSKQIAISLNLNDEDIELASICGLYHDIGRFNQWTNYQTYEDHESIDHGDEAYKVLIETKIIDNFKEKDIILNSIKYHNKYSLPNLDERTLLFIKIVRDADKLDIMKEQCNHIYQEKIVLKKELLNDIYNKTVCKNEYIANEVDAILRMLAWVFDIYFKYTYELLISNKIIENKFNLLEIYGETEEINNLKKFIYDEMEKRL